MSLELNKNFMYKKMIKDKDIIMPIVMTTDRDSKGSYKNFMIFYHEDLRSQFKIAGENVDVESKLSARYISDTELKKYKISYDNVMLSNAFRYCISSIFYSEDLAKDPNEFHIRRIANSYRSLEKKEI